MSRVAWCRLVPSLVAALLFTSAALADWQLHAGHVRGLPPGQTVTAAYLTVHNHGAEPLELVGASSPVAEVTEIHRSESEGGVMRMVQVERLEVPAGGRVEMRPGGLHLMLLGLQRTLSAGEEVAITLHAADGSERSLTLPVRSVLDEEPRRGHDHHHH